MFAIYRGSPEVDPEQLRKVGTNRMLSVNTIDVGGLMRRLPRLRHRELLELHEDYTPAVEATKR